MKGLYKNGSEDNGSDASLINNEWAVGVANCEYREKIVFDEHDLSNLRNRKRISYSNSNNFSLLALPLKSL